MDLSVSLGPKLQVAFFKNESSKGDGGWVGTTKAMEYSETLDQRHQLLHGSGKPAAALADDTKTLFKQKLGRKDLRRFFIA